jgi:hypothetical protein
MSLGDIIAPHPPWLQLALIDLPELETGKTQMRLDVARRMAARFEFQRLYGMGKLYLCSRTMSLTQ